MTEKLESYVQMKIKGIEDKEIKRKNAKMKTNKKYKETKCASLQVFLDKDMVTAFKAKVKEKGESQAGVIKRFIKSYLAV